MWLRIAERHSRFDHVASLASSLAAIFDQRLPVQVKPEAFCILASIAVVHAHTQFVLAGRWWSEAAAPAHRVIVALQAVYGNDLVPIEIDVTVGTRQDRRAAQIGRAEILAGESVARTARSMKRGMLDGHREALNQSRSLRISHLRGGEPFLNSVERMNRRRRWTVVVALQGLYKFGGGADHGDASDPGFERECVILVFQQHNRFPRRAQRQLPVLWRVDLPPGNAPIGKTGRRVEHAELKSRPEESAQRGVKLGFLDQVPMNRINQCRERL